MAAGHNLDFISVKTRCREFVKFFNMLQAVGHPGLKSARKGFLTPHTNSVSYMAAVRR